jgi:Glycosyltransferase family 87
VEWIRTHFYQIATVLFLTILGVGFFNKPDEDSEWEVVNVRAAARLRGGEEVYNHREGFLYPPFAALIALPFTELSPLPMRAAWFAVNAIALILLVHFAWKIASGGGVSTRTEALAWWLGLACGLRYAIDCLAHQQTDVVIGALLIGGCYALVRDRPLLAATLIGLAAGCKATPVLFVVYFVWRGYWLAALWLLGVAVGVNLLPDLVHASPTGEPWLLRWLHLYALPSQGHVGVWGCDPVYNQSLSGAFYRFFSSDYMWTSTELRVFDRRHPLDANALRTMVYGFEMSLTLVMAWVVGKPHWRSLRTANDAAPSRRALECSVALLLALLVSPASSKPHFCTMLLPAFCLARLAVVEKRYMPGVFLLAAIGVSVPSVKDLWGGNFSAVALWWGCVTWSAAALLVGSAWSLVTCRAAVPRTGFKVADRTVTSALQKAA